jgi:hypothetical protein
MVLTITVVAVSTFEVMVETTRVEVNKLLFVIAELPRVEV